jgi:hypothetical protein
LLAFASLLLVAEGCFFSVFKHGVIILLHQLLPPLSSDTMATSPAKMVVGFDVLAD